MRKTIDHKIKGYSIVFISLKPPGKPPGDISANQMKKLAKLSKKFSFGEIRSTHEQNLILPHVEKRYTFKIWEELKKIGLSTPNIGLISDIICWNSINLAEKFKNPEKNEKH